MLKIRRPLGRLIFNMEIAIPGKTVFLIETAPWFVRRLKSTQCYYTVNIHIYFSLQSKLLKCQLRTGNSIDFWHTNRCSWKSVKDFDTEIVSTQGGLELPTFRFMLNGLPFELPGPDICYPMFWNTGSGSIDIFVGKVNIWNVNCTQGVVKTYPRIAEANISNFSTWFYKKWI